MSFRGFYRVRVEGFSFYGFGTQNSDLQVPLKEGITTPVPGFAVSSGALRFHSVGFRRGERVGAPKPKPSIPNPKTTDPKPVIS